MKHVGHEKRPLPPVIPPDPDVEAFLKNLAAQTGLTPLTSETDQTPKERIAAALKMSINGPPIEYSTFTVKEGGRIDPIEDNLNAEQVTQLLRQELQAEEKAKLKK